MSTQNHFDKIIEQGLAKGMIPNSTKEAITWYRNAAKRVATVSPASLFTKGGVTGTSRTLSPEDLYAMTNNTMLPDHLYMFHYDPKMKATLPYYDTFPLVLPLNKARGGFLGLNLHYLPPHARGVLMDGILNRSGSSSSYGKYFAPCIKHYLFSHINSRFINIPEDEWDIAIFLPTARFQKTNQSEVWIDSMKKIRGY